MSRFRNVMVFGTLLLGAGSSVCAATVNNLTGFYSHGQIFLTYKRLPDVAGTKVRYRAYESSSIIDSFDDLEDAVDLGDVLDDSGLNERYTAVSDAVDPIRFKIPSSSGTKKVAKDHGLFVATVTSSGAHFYAITTKKIISGVEQDEELTIVLGENALTVPIQGDKTQPKPVYQETVSGNPDTDIYVLYVTQRSTKKFPQMTTAGSYGYNFAVRIQPGPDLNALYMDLHAGGGSFYNTTAAIPEGSVYVQNDDYIPYSPGGAKVGSSTMWFGFHQDFDIYDGLPAAPTDGTVMNFTAARVEFTRNWAVKNDELKIDSNRVYLQGESAGGTGAWLIGLMYPDKYAAFKSQKASWMFPSSSGSDEKNLMFGTGNKNLPTNVSLEGYINIPFYDLIDAVFLLEGVYQGKSVPVMIAINGKNDTTTGWGANMLPLYESLDISRHGGFFYFDQRNHSGGSQDSIGPRWTPEQVEGESDDQGNGENLASYRLDRSYPAFSNVSCDSNPGKGSAANGDLYGTIHGMVDWKPASVAETPTSWSVKLYARARAVDSGSDQESLVPDTPCIVDVTVRRVQKLELIPGKSYTWSYGSQGGVVTYDGTNLTIENIELKTNAKVLTIQLVN